MTHATFLLQMAGVPGSGKSALARLIGHRTGAVVIDKDILKSAALETGMDHDKRAGQVAYESFFALADHLLGQGLSVVLDSPSFYETIPARGSAIAGARMVPYYFIECVCDDGGELERRLRDRPRLSSHPETPVDSERWKTFGPPEPFLRVDTTQPVEWCLALALEYLGRASG